jgi:NADPH:quinone reductase-like Zn-dependent oxidoreductase
MKALIYSKKSRPDRLVYGDVEKPLPGDKEVLIKVLAVSINAADYRSKQLGLIPQTKIFGADVAGRIEATGKNTSRFKPGDEVLGDLVDCGFGGLAEYAVAPEKLLTRKPPALSFIDAASLPIASLTALQALRDKGRIQQGQKVLIVGSGGGVGTFAVQLAKYYGAEVTAVCSTKNVDQSRSIGADFVMDYTQEDFTRINRLFDIILAVNGNTSLLAYRKLLNKNGINVMVGGSMKQIFSSLLLGWLFSFGSKKMVNVRAKMKTEDLEFVANLTAKGKIKPVIDSIYTLDKSAEAFKYAAGGHAKGKVMVTVEHQSETV